MEVVRDRASDRGCTGRSEGASGVGPPGGIPGGFSFWRWDSARPPRSCWERPPCTSSLTRESRPSWYLHTDLHTAAREPHGPLARLNREVAALAARGGMMLILKYFLVVGAVLTLGLIALNAHLLPDGSKAPVAVIHSPTTASLPTVAPNVPAADTNV